MNPNSIILKAVARLLVFFINTFALYLLLRGHNNPGGGFIAGLVTAISLVLLVMSLGIDEVKRIIRVDPVFLTLIGLFLAYIPSLIPTLFNLSFLKQTFYHGVFPLLGEVHVGTPLIFDLGVYFVVVGITTKIIMTFSYLIYERKDYFLEEQFKYSSSHDEPVSQSEDAEVKE